MNTQETAPSTVPSTPAPDLSALVGSIIRSSLLLASGLGIYHGAAIDDGTLMLLSSTVVGIGSAAWSIIAKIRAAKAAHSTALASAVAGAPVKPAT